MNGFDDDFFDFLKANFPTDYYKALSEDVKPETLSRIFSNHSNYFNTWKRVPQSLRTVYGGVLPTEIMELAAEGNDVALRYISEHNPLEPEIRSQEEHQIRYADYSPATAELATTPVFLYALSVGYLRESALEFARNSNFRDILRDKALHNTLNDEEFNDWLKSRANDKKTIKKDWAKQQPEKLLVHLFTKFNRGKISEDELISQAAELMKKIERNHRHEHLLAYIKKRPIQCKISHFRDDVLDTFSQTILHEIPKSEKREYLRRSIPLKSELRQLIDLDNSGQIVSQQQIEKIVKEADNKGVGLDFSNYTNESTINISSDLNQKFLIACCVHNVPYRGVKDEHIDLNSDYVKSLPLEVQALVASRNMQLSKGNMIKQTGNNIERETILKNIPSILNNRRNTNVA